MEEDFLVRNIKEEIEEIIRLYVKYSLIIVLVSICIVIFFSLQENRWDNLTEQLLLTVSLIQLVSGIVIFLYHSSYSSGFDAIWTPQMQGEIQRDERKRQITGWTKAAFGALLIVSGIIALFLFLDIQNFI